MSIAESLASSKTFRPRMHGKFCMIIRRQCAVLSLAALFLLVLTANVYFVYVIVDDKSPYVSTPPNILTIRTEKNGMSTEKRKFDKAEKKKQQKSAVFYRNATLLATLRIEKNLVELPERYHKVTSEHRFILLQLLQDLNSSDELSTTLWDTASKDLVFGLTSIRVGGSRALALGSGRGQCWSGIAIPSCAGLEMGFPFYIQLCDNIKYKTFFVQPLYNNLSYRTPTLVRKPLTSTPVNNGGGHIVSRSIGRWVSSREVLPAQAPQLGSVLRTLCSTRIIRAENAQRGTQLKLMLTLSGNQRAIFKPQWYSRAELIDGPVYAGKDRHNAEVAAFHLAVLLGLRRSPLTVGRKVNLRREVMPVATDNLLDTFYQEALGGRDTEFRVGDAHWWRVSSHSFVNTRGRWHQGPSNTGFAASPTTDKRMKISLSILGNNTCFYGVCYYCSPQDPVCAKRDVMEGALIMWLPHGYILKKYRNPWQRTYKTDVLARWEVDQQYCDKVKLSRLYASDQGSRLLDIVDSAIFDFLIDNGDRHHYEVFENFNNSVVLLLDNGKRLRNSTWRRLQLFTGNTLGSSLSSLLEHSHIAPVLATTHLQALNRRLMLIFAAVEECLSQHNPSQVLVNR
uniref:FAM20 C-terminal domain-containing protein n=1 Tax=Timema monikensis TaxID=170555 RepID=A0A7R9EED8_9NEOP|nr:unnamed protein product [Timema monikensis]